MNIAIIQFPGSNTERETLMACRRVELNPVEFLWNEPAEKLSDFDGFIIVGGFSYEDRSRAGVIAAQDPIMKQIKIEAESGKPILGICNGAQILVETGLVPGLANHRVGVALTDNKRVKGGHVLGVGYYNTWANLQLTASAGRCAFTRKLKTGSWITVPLAHGEGRFIIPNELLEKMKDIMGRRIDEMTNSTNMVMLDLTKIVETIKEENPDLKIQVPKVPERLKVEDIEKLNDDDKKKLARSLRGMKDSVSVKKLRMISELFKKKEEKKKEIDENLQSKDYEELIKIYNNIMQIEEKKDEEQKLMMDVYYELKRREKKRDEE